MASTPAFVGTPKRALAKLVNATGTTLTTLCTLASGGGILEALFVTSDDGTSRKITWYIGDGSTDVKVNTVTIPAATSGTPVQVVNLLDPTTHAWLDPANVRMVLGGSTVIKVQMDGAVTSAKETSVVALYGEF